MATATFTTVEARVTQQLTNAIWADEIQDNLNQLGGAHRNLLTNGGFEVWQRGAGPFGGSGFYTADRWTTSLFAGTNTVTKETTTIDGGAASLKNVVTSPTSIYILQRIEDYAQLRGQTISLSVRVNQSVASGAVAVITDSSGTTTGSAVATTGSFVTLTVTRTLGAAITTLDVGVQFTAAGTFYLDNAMLVIGPAPAPYRPLHPQEELARCQRYYEILSADYNTVASAGAQNLGYALNYRQDKGGTPTLTKNGTWSVTNCGQPSVTARTGQETRMVTIFAASTAAGVMQFTANSGDDTISAEWNP